MGVDSRLSAQKLPLEAMQQISKERSFTKRFQLRPTFEVVDDMSAQLADAGRSALSAAASGAAVAEWP